MNRDLSLVHALGLEIPSSRLLDSFGDRVLQQMPPLEPNGPNGARNRGYGANGPAVNGGPAIERNLIQIQSDLSDSDDDQLDPTGEAQDVNQPKNGNHEFQDVGNKDAATKGDMEDTIP
mmetsp:Transcript_124353/g.175423  ORF Transcript_124353/g.175423 Transcript_124353/m.175423 type:complete len:119 (-) Transcript_124353:49-405(-)|eukprot:symbB.v1.2.005428.t1/scaffold312.1/size231221/4